MRNIVSGVTHPKEKLINFKINQENYSECNRGNQKAQKISLRLRNVRLNNKFQ